jgi:hypothetical protein
MKRLICATVACLMLGGTVVWASPTQGMSKKHNAQSGEKDNAPEVIYNSHTNVIIDVAVLF